MNKSFLHANTDKNIYSLNSLKLTLSIMVVFIHTRIFLDNSVLLDTFTSNGFFRIAVPVFFIMNGYFLPSTKNSFKKWLIKSTCIYLSLTALYAFFWLDYSTLTTSIKTIAHALLAGYSHLWYIQAMIIAGLIIFYFKNSTPLLIISVCFFLFGFFIQIYTSYQHAINPDLPQRYSIYRNAFTIGLPFMLIGYLFRTKWIHTPQKTTIIICLFSAILLGIEVFINYAKFTSNQSLSKSISFDIYLSLIMLCSAIFLLFKNMESGIKINKNIPNYIYFFHPIPILLLNKKLSSVNNIIYSALIIIITLIISPLVIKITKELRKNNILRA